MLDNHILSSIENQEKINNICETIINSVSTIKKKSRIRLFNLKSTKKTLTCNTQIAETIEGLFGILKQEGDGKVSCAELIDHLTSLGIKIDRLLFDNVIIMQIFIKYLKLPKLAQARISQESFYSLLFSDRKSDLLLEKLKRFKGSNRTLSLLPNLKVMIQPGCLSPGLGQGPADIGFPGQEPKPVDYFKILNLWWAEIDKQESGVLPLSTVLALLIKKDIAYNMAEAKKILNVSSNSVLKSDFFGIFSQAILKSQFLELVGLMGSISKSKPFTNAFHKISSIKRKILLSRISPRVDEVMKFYDKTKLPTLIKFHRHARSVAPPNR
jgi:hypothetical protein